MLKKLLALAALMLVCPAVWAKTVVIDVRTPQEFASGHIQGALNIDHSVIAQRISMAGVAKDDEVILYCRSGNRSGIAMQTLNKLGYTRVLNFGSVADARAKLQKRAAK